MFLLMKNFCHLEKRGKKQQRGEGEEAAPALLSHSARAVLPPWGLLAAPLDRAQVGTQCSPPRSQAGTLQRPSSYTLGEGASGCIDAHALPGQQVLAGCAFYKVKG